MVIGAACGSDSDSGTIEIDGSSTVYPITEAVAEEFHKVQPGVQVNVGYLAPVEGSSGSRLGETDISDASRPIKASEAEAAAENGIEYLGVEGRTDGLSVMVHPDNSFVDCLTIKELADDLEPESEINNWNQVRPGFRTSDCGCTVRTRTLDV